MRKLLTTMIVITLLTGCTATANSSVEKDVATEGIMITGVIPAYEIALSEYEMEIKGIDIPDCFKYTILKGKYIITGYTGTDSVVVIPEGVYSIGYEAFKCNTTITKVVLPQSLEIIDNYAFDSCENLTEINFPDNLTAIMDSAISYTGIKCAILPDSVEYIGESAFKATDVSNVVLPDGIQHLYPNTFRYCHYLKEIELPSALKSIGEECFSSTSLESVIVPEGCERIENQAFYGTWDMKAYLPSTITYLGKYVFGCENTGYVDGLKVYVPSYNPTLNNLDIYGPDAIVYTKDTELEKLYRLTKSFERKLYIDMNFDGFPEVLNIDKYNSASILYLDNNAFDLAEIVGGQRDSFYTGEDRRTLTHCRSADEEFYLLTSVNVSKDISARVLKIIPLGYGGYSCEDIGTQDYIVYDESGNEASVIAKQHIGGEFGIMSERMSKSELEEKLYCSFMATLDEYFEQYEIVEEYELDEYLECYEKGETPPDINLGEFTVTSSDTKRGKDSEYIAVSGREYNSNSNRVRVYTGKSHTKIDFDELAKFQNLTCLYIDLDVATDLAGIKKLSGVCEVNLNVGKNGQLVNMVALSQLKNIQVITLRGNTLDVDFGTGYTKIVKDGEVIYIRN